MQTTVHKTNERWCITRTVSCKGDDIEVRGVSTYQPKSSEYFLKLLLFQVEGGAEYWAPDQQASVLVTAFPIILDRVLT